MVSHTAGQGTLSRSPSPPDAVPIADKTMGSAKTLVESVRSSSSRIRSRSAQAAELSTSMEAEESTFKIEDITVFSRSAGSRAT
mmetsp:Transcript_25378/g.41770  ORF Transcript_25378/g.41770 Transcript_25378/m.41770 type:complete len:84 (-) Transcript_25378:1548-1799(-)